MTHDTPSPVELAAGSACWALHEKVLQHFAWLFARYAVRLIECEYFEGYQTCRLVYLVDGVIQLQFSAERGGVEWRVAPAGTNRDDPLEWVLPSDVVNYMARLGPQFTESSDWAPLNVDRILDRKSAELEPTIAEIIEFYRSEDYEVRREEFQRFREAYDEEFMSQVNEYYAKRRGSPPLTAG